MKKILFVAVVIFIGSYGHSQNISIPDANFKTLLISTNCADLDDNGTLESDVDTNNDGEIQESEALAVFRLFSSSGGGNPPIRISGNNETETPNLTIYDATGIEFFLNLKALSFNAQQLSTLNVSMLSQLQQLNVLSNQLTSLTLGNLPNLTFLDCRNNNLTSLDLFGVLALATLKCNTNELTELNLQNLSNLTTLDCRSNNLTSLNLSFVPLLIDLRCSNNEIVELNTESVPMLIFLECSSNNISSLNVQGMNNLNMLSFSDNNLVSIDVSNLPMLQTFSGGNNLLSSVTISNNPALINIYVNDNLIEHIDASDTGVKILRAQNNPNLTSVVVKNGVNSPQLVEQFPFPPEAPFNFENTPALQTICGDEGELEWIIESLNGQAVNVSSYCTFGPGGASNTIAGNILLDCGNGNIPISAANIYISDGTQTGIAFTNTAGNYSFLTNTGFFNVSTQFEYPEYFSISPAIYDIEFTTFENEAQADFCITPNGIHPDLEVTLFPITPARPGFDAVYEIIYKNIGTETQSGSVILNYDDTILELASALPSVTLQTSNMLSWDFIALMPFESRSITVRLNVNSPVETPPVNIDDTLIYSAAVTSAMTDHSPENNIFNLNQTVIGSIDPNDKIVLQGETISTSEIDNYLHYIVRFQNTGTAPAEFVVIKDILADNLDVSSLRILSSSHPYVSTLSQGNTLEVFFGNINLPPQSEDEEGSNGYVAFKIKPSQTVALGSIIENMANIYFDYNFPVVTNTVSTTVTALEIAANIRSGFIVYPNPATNFVTIESGNEEIISIAIFNTLGQVVKMENADENSKLQIVDVSNFNSGVYFIEVIGRENKTVKKFIKE